MDIPDSDLPPPVAVQCSWSNRRVSIDRKGWRHVADHHPEMIFFGAEEDVERAITTPLYITDAGLPGPNPRKYAYYAEAPFGFRATDMLKVVVKLASRARGFIESAYLVTAIKPTETVVWRRP